MQNPIITGKRKRNIKEDNINKFERKYILFCLFYKDEEHHLIDEWYTLVAANSNCASLIKDLDIICSNTLVANNIDEINSIGQIFKLNGELKDSLNFFNMVDDPTFIIDLSKVLKSCREFKMKSFLVDRTIDLILHKKPKKEFVSELSNKKFKSDIQFFISLHNYCPNGNTREIGLNVYVFPKKAIELVLNLKDDERFNLLYSQILGVNSDKDLESIIHVFDQLSNLSFEEFHIINLLKNKSVWNKFIGFCKGVKIVDKEPGQLLSDLMLSSSKIKL